MEFYLSTKIFWLTIKIVKKILTLLHDIILSKSLVQDLVALLLNLYETYNIIMSY